MVWCEAAFATEPDAPTRAASAFYCGGPVLSSAAAGIDQALWVRPFPEVAAPPP